DVLGAMQLERGELYDEEVKTIWVTNSLQNRCSDITDGNSVEPLGACHRLRHRGDSRLAIRTGQNHPLSCTFSLALTHSPSELYVTPHWNIRLLGCHKHGVI